VSELQLHRVHLADAVSPASVSVAKDKVSRRSQRDGGDGSEGVQLPLVVSVLAHVIPTVSVPGGQETTFSRETHIQLLV